MTKISVPCLGCPERNENCHSICGRYKEYKKSLAKQNEQIRKAVERMTTDVPHGVVSTSTEKKQ